MGLITSGTNNVEIKKGVVAQVLVKDANGSLAAVGSTVSIYNGNTLLGTGLTNSNCIALVAGVPLTAGNTVYKVVANILGENGGVAQKDNAVVTLTNGSVNTIEIQGTKGVTVSGKITFENGTVPPNSVITIKDASGQEIAQSSLTDSGYYTLANIADGSYSVEVVSVYLGEMLYANGSLTISQNAAHKFEYIPNTTIKDTDRVLPIETLLLVNNGNLVIKNTDNLQDNKDVTEFINKISALESVTSIQDFTTEIAENVSELSQIYSSLSEIEKLQISETYKERLNKLLSLFVEFKQINSDAQVVIENTNINISQQGLMEGVLPNIAIGRLLQLAESQGVHSTKLLAELLVEDITAACNSKQEEEIKQIQNLAPNATIGMVFNASVRARLLNAENDEQIGNAETINVLAEPVRIILEVPEHLTNNYYAVATVHGNEPAKLLSTEIIRQSGSLDKIAVDAKEFSTYAIFSSATPFIVQETPTVSKPTSTPNPSQKVCYDIAVTAGKGGSASTGQHVSVPEGDSAGFTFTPDKGYALADVKVDGKSVGAVSYYVITNVTANHTITATFKKVELTPPQVDNSNSSETAEETQEGNTVYTPEEFWQKTTELLESASKGSIIKINAGQLTQIPATVLHALLGKDVNLLIISEGTSNIIINGINMYSHNKKDTYTLQELYDAYYGFELAGSTAPTDKQAFDVVYSKDKPQQDNSDQNTENSQGSDPQDVVEVIDNKENEQQCKLCTKCSAPLGICVYIWLFIVAIGAGVVGFFVKRKNKEQQ